MQRLRKNLAPCTARHTPSSTALAARLTTSTSRFSEGSTRGPRPDAVDSPSKDGSKEKPKLGDEVLVPRVLPPLSAGRPLAGVMPVFRSRLVDAGLTTIIGLGMVLVGGVTYVEWYKKKVLTKMEQAFEEGYDPALEVAAHAKRRLQAGHPTVSHLRRKEQDIIDRIIGGLATGHYYMLLGSKGSGKTTMIYDAMQSVNALGVVVCEAHPNPEVFRHRLGQALNFEYNEDSQTGLFYRRDPRQAANVAGAALDIERALSKLERVALRSARKLGRPLVLIFNNVHFFQHTEEGKNILLQLQQRAEAWAESGILTMVFSTDDHWPFHVLRKSSSRMQVISIYDLSLHDATHATQHMRLSAGRPSAPEDAIRRALMVVGGRLSHINRVARAEDVSVMAAHMLQLEKGWLLSHIGLIPDCDIDALEEQKWSAYSWLLLREFVKIHKEMEEQRQVVRMAGLSDKAETDDVVLPSMPYWRCRQVLSRSDFINDLDKCNIIAIDVNHNIRPDSMLILQAAREIVEQEGFNEQLDLVCRRIDEIEGLRRTRELKFEGNVSLKVKDKDKDGKEENKRHKAAKKKSEHEGEAVDHVNDGFIRDRQH